MEADSTKLRTVRVLYVDRLGTCVSMLMNADDYAVSFTSQLGIRYIVADGHL